MSDTKRCPACGAQNASTAEWCTLCLTRFAPLPVPRPEESPSEVAAELAALTDGATPTLEAPPEGEEAAELVPAGEPEPEPPPPVAQAPVRFVREDDKVRWVCPSCDTVNDLESGACRICGTVMARLFAPREMQPKRARPAALTAALSAVLPGAGHLLQGETPTAVSRMLLYLWTVAIAILLVARAPAEGKAVVRTVGYLFGGAAAGIWVVSMTEGLRLSKGDRTPLVPARMLTWIFTALTLALFVGVLFAAAAGRRS